MADEQAEWLSVAHREAAKAVHATAVVLEVVGFGDQSTMEAGAGRVYGYLDSSKS